MAVNYVTNVKNARLGVTLDYINAGSGPGKIQIGTTSFATVLATIPLTAQGGTIAGGVLTLDTPVSDTSADNTGTAALARILDSDDNVVLEGLTVGVSGSGANVIINATAISAGQVITVTSATITHG